MAGQTTHQTKDPTRRLSSGKQDLEAQEHEGPGSFFKRVGRILGRFILEPLDLWLGRKLILDGEQINGLPRIAAFINSDPDSVVTIYKKFNALSTRNLLLLETRVAALEAVQKALDETDWDNQVALHDMPKEAAVPGIVDSTRLDKFSLISAPQSFEYFALLAHETHSPDHSFEVDDDIPEVALRRWREMRTVEMQTLKNNSLVPGKINKFTYFKERWEVALAIQKALKEYRKSPLRCMSAS